jgi:hypothetical protein
MFTHPYQPGRRFTGRNPSAGAAVREPLNEET